MLQPDQSQKHWKKCADATALTGVRWDGKVQDRFLREMEKL